MTTLSTATMLHSVYPIPPVSRGALSAIIADTAAVVDGRNIDHELPTLDEAEAAIKVALAMQYALMSGAFSPRIIKILRINVLGMKQYELANRLSYSQTAVSAWEHGSAECPAAAYVAIVDMVRARLDRNIKLQRMGQNVRERLATATDDAED
jgi:DNA-binding transcriptional regulator YiaG